MSEKQEIEPEIIDVARLIREHRRDEDSPEAWAHFVIIAAVTKRCSTEEFGALFDFEAHPDRMEIVFTVNGIQVPFMETIKRFHEVVEDRVQKKLDEVLCERFSALDDFLCDAREAIRSAAEVKLGVKIDSGEEE